MENKIKAVYIQSGGFTSGMPVVWSGMAAGGSAAAMAPPPSGDEPDDPGEEPEIELKLSRVPCFI